MRILFIEPRPSFVGGSERMSLMLCQHAVRRGHQAWLAYAEPGDMVPAYEAAGAMCVRLPISPVMRAPISTSRSLAALWRLVHRESIDLLFTSHITFVSMMAIVALPTRAETVVHLGLVYETKSRLFHWAMSRFGLGITPSAHMADAWRALQWPSASLCVIPNGVDTAVFTAAADRSAAKRQLAARGGCAPLIAYVGRILKDKGVLTLMRAFGQYRRDGGDAHLLFVGPAETETIAELRQIAHAHRLDGAWEMRPATNAPETVYRAADVVVVPSEWDEPFGLVPLEAMACGALTLVSDRGVLPELMPPGQSSVVVPAGDSDRLAERMAFWLGDDGRRRAAAEVQRAHVLDRFAFERCGDAYLAAFAALREARS